MIGMLCPPLRRIASRKIASRFLVPLCIAPLALAGCYCDDDDDHDETVIVTVPPTAFGSDTEFTWSGTLYGYSATDEYLWTTVWDEVFIEFIGLDYFGEVRVQIFDELFIEIFDQTFFGSGDFLQIDTVSDLGLAGEWTILITSFDVFGQVTLRLD